MKKQIPVTDADEGALIPEETFDAATASLAEKPTYAGTFDDQIQGIYEKIANREPFSYDVNADPLYQMYKDQYVQGGKMAMRDTMGKAAGLTGGYGSSYGQRVGQQAYDASLQELTAMIPQLYGQAYQQYRDQGDDLKDLYGMAGDLRDKEYQRYRDELGDYRYEDETAYSRGRDELADRRYDEQTVYDRGRDTLADQRYDAEIARQQEQLEYDRRQAEENTAYQRQQQAYSSLYAIIKAAGYYPSDAELQAAGMTRAAADALRTEYMRVNGLLPVAAPSGGGGGGRSKATKDEDKEGEKAQKPASTTPTTTYASTQEKRDYLAYLESQGYSKGSQLYQTAARQIKTYGNGGR